MNLNNLYNNYIKWVFYKKEYSYNKNLDSINIILDGLICQELVTCYYVILLNTIKQIANKNIILYIVVGNTRAKYHQNNRVFKKYFKTNFIVLDKKIYKGYKQSDDLNKINNLFNVSYEKNIYSGFLRVFEIGKFNKNDILYRKFYYNWKNNYLNFNSKLSKLEIHYCFLTDSVYHHFGLIFKASLKYNIKTIVTIPYDNSGMIGGRIYMNLEDYFIPVRNYVLSYTDKTYDNLKSTITHDSLTDFVETRFSGKQNIFDGHYHKNTQKFDFLELDSKFNYNNNFKKKILVASHLLWDDVNSSFSNIYEDYETWVISTLKIALENSNMLWIFKAHPSEKHFGTKRSLKHLFSEYFEFLPSNIILLEPDSNINTYQLINYSDIIITVRGSIGFEAAMLGKPVLNAGSGPYSNLGFNIELTTIEAYENILNNLQSNKYKLTDLQIQNAKIASYIYFVSKCPISDIVKKFNSINKLISIFKLDDIIYDQTLNRFAKQILINNNGDLL